MLTTVFIAGPKTTVTVKYWELLSTSVSVKAASCGTVCVGVRHRCLYDKFLGALIGDGVLIEKSTCYPGHLNWRRGAYWIQGAN